MFVEQVSCSVLEELQRCGIRSREVSKEEVRNSRQERARSFPGRGLRQGEGMTGEQINFAKRW